MSGLRPIDWALRPLKRYATFSGRAPRAEYWWFYLLTIVVGTPLRLIDKGLGTSQVFSAIFNLAVFLPFLALTVRRLHDTNRSGGWLLAAIALIAVLVAVVIGVSGSVEQDSLYGSVGAGIAGLLMVAIGVTFLIFMVLPGTEGPNDYGPDPYGPDDLEEVFA